MPLEGLPTIEPLTARGVVRICDVSGLWPLAERLRVSSGVERPTAGAAYESGAFVPRAPWRAVPEGALAALTAPPSAWESRSTIALVRIPAEAYAGLARVGLAQATDLDAYAAAHAHPDFDAALEETSFALGRYLTSLDGLRVLGTAARAAGLCTVTSNNEDGALVGLHVDAWDDLVPTGHGTNRICLNLGREERAFLFVPLAADSLGLKDLRTSSERVERFFDAHPECPVIRIRLAPGEAYIAPTEHVLHDGSTESSRSLDITLTLRGQFGL